MPSVTFQPVPRRPGRLPLLLLACAACFPQTVRAQAMNYGALEDLFGEPVTTTATGTPQRASEAPANMSIVTADDIRRSGSRNVPEILERIAGLEILRTGLNAFDVGVRGYQQPMQPRMLVLIDGRQVFLDDYSRTDWSNLPLNIDDIRQIEVVKGAASALFGSNAASGVINIVTRSPQFDGGISVNTTLGTQEHRSIDTTIRLKGANGGVKLSFGGLDAREFDTPRLPFDGFVTPASLNGTEPPTHRYVALSAAIGLADNLQGTAEGSWTRSVSNPADNTDFNVVSVQHDESYSIGGGLNWDSKWGTIGAKGYLNHTFVTLYETGAGSLGFGTKMNLVSLQIQDQLKLGKHHKIRIGVDYRFRDYRQYNDQTIVQDPHLVQHILSIDGTWLWQVNDQLAFSTALRLDHQAMRQAGQINPTNVFGYGDYQHDNDAISANVALNYNPTAKDHIRVGYGRGVMMPSLIQNGYSQIVNFGYPFLIDAEGNPLLKPTIVQDVGIDYTRSIDALSSTVRVSLYSEWSRNIIAPFVGGPMITIAGQDALANYAQNVGSSRGWGGEIEWKGAVDSGFRWDLSYSYVHVTDDDMVKSLLDYADSSPRHHLRAKLGYSIGNWEVDATAHCVSSTAMLRNVLDSNPPVRTDGYASFGGRIGYALTDHLRFGLSGSNLTRKLTQVSAFPLVERQVFLGLTANY